MRFRFFPWSWTNDTPQSDVNPLGAFDRAELWSSTLGGSGGRVAVLTPVVAVRTTHRLDGRVATSKAVVTLPRSWDQVGNVASTLYPRRVLRLYDTSGGFEEYRITNVDDSSGRDGMTKITGIGVIYDLGDAGEVVSELINNQVSYTVPASGTVTSLLTTALTFGPSYITLGDVTSTAVVDVTWSTATPLSAAVAVADAASLKDGVEYDLSLRQHGAGYYLDCNVLNVSADAPDVRTGKNLASLLRGQMSRDMVNRVFPIGTNGQGIGDNWWKVTAVSANTYIDITDPSGGGHPLWYDDALNNYYVVDDANGTHQITDSSIQGATTARLNMASTTSIAVGDWVRIALNSSRDEFAHLDNTSSQAIFGVATGVVRPDVPGVTNWAKNPDYADWTGANPADWSVTGTSPTKITTAGLWLSGGQSARINGINRSLSQTRSIYMRAGESLTYTVRVRIAAFGGAGATLEFTIPQSGATDTYYLDGTQSGLDTLDTWLTFSRTYQATSAGAKTCKALWNMNASAGGIDIYVDSAAYTLTTSAADFVRHSGPTTLWLYGLQHLSNFSEAQTTYDMDLADLTRLDSERWPDDALMLGGTINVRDTDLSLTLTPRVVALERDELDRTDTKVTLSTRRPDLARYLAGRV